MSTNFHDCKKGIEKKRTNFAILSLFTILSRGHLSQINETVHIFQSKIVNLQLPYIELYKQDKT